MPDTGLRCDVSQLGTHSGVRPHASARWSGHDAKQRADRELGSGVKPGLELLPGPLVHPDLAAMAALAAPHEQRPAASVQVALVERQGLVNAQSGAPEHDDQSR